MTIPGSSTRANAAPNAIVALSSARNRSELKFKAMQGHDMECAAPPDLAALARDIRRWAAELGFQQLGITDCELSGAEARLLTWLERGWHGDMDYMARHGVKRSRPGELVAGTVRVISVRMNYLPAGARDSAQVLNEPGRAFLSRYALG